MRVKVCGLTRRRDVRRAVELGATHLGCVIAPDSPRAVGIGRAETLLRGLPGRVTPVLVFRAVPVDRIAPAARRCGVPTVQLHGYCAGDIERVMRSGLEVMQAVDASRGTRPAIAEGTAPVVFDVGGGGTGRTFDWAMLAPRAPRHVFIAGGLTPENVGALLPFDPWGVDVSSGIESRPGVKDHARMAGFFRAVCGREEESFDVR